MSNEETQAVIDKVRKILARTSSSSEAEAETAMRMAHDILKKYNLSLGDITEKTEALADEVIEEGSRERSWRTMLLLRIAKYNYCSIYRMSGKAWKPGSQRRVPSYNIHLIGKEVNIQSTKIMIDYLMATVERLSKNHKGAGKEFIESYKLGLSEGLCARLMYLREKEEIQQECTALVVREDAAIQDFFDKQKMKSSTIKTNASNGVGRMMGQLDSNNINLNDQLGEHKEKQLALS